MFQRIWGGSGRLKKKQSYPFTRLEECSWEPHEFVQRLSTVLSKSESLEGHSCHSPSSGRRVLVDDFLSQGLTSAHAEVMCILYGRNSLGTSDGDESMNWWWGWWVRWFGWAVSVFRALLSQLKEPLIIVLIVSAAISLVLGNESDAISIIVALAIVGLVAAVQEYRSEVALLKLINLVPHTCTVVRDGNVHSRFPARDLVVGDSIILATGDRVPADCRLLHSVQLCLDESNLTGETAPVEKSSSGLDSIGGSNWTKSPPIAEQRNIVFMGTLVYSGHAKAVVVAIGTGTEFGKVAHDMGDIESPQSPLQQQIAKLGKTLATTSGVVILLVGMIGCFLGRPFLETVTLAVSLAVAAIPEGLPICVTVTLALAVLRMARSNAIVKKLPAVEALGSTTVIVSDKTGTLTQNQMTATSVYLPSFPSTYFHFRKTGGDLWLSSVLPSYPMQAITTPADQDVAPPSSTDNTVELRITIENPEYSAVETLFGVATLCNNASIALTSCHSPTSSLPVASSSAPRSTGWLEGMSGRPTELALLVAADKISIPDLRPLYHRIEEVPFNSERKRMEVRARPIGPAHPCKAFKLASSEELERENVQRCAGNSLSYATSNNSLYFVKGMPEAVLSECNSFTNKHGSANPMSDRMRWQALVQSRSMAASGLRVLAMAYGATLDKLTFAGFVGMEDPPRNGVARAVEGVRCSGVRVVMMTGDAKETAISIAAQCGFFSDVGRVDFGSLSSLSPSVSLRNESENGGVVASANEYRDIYFPLQPCEDNATTVLALSGEELDAVSPDKLAEAIAGVRVFHRVTPHHKLAVVRALQSQGEVIAMTGDGINDATALKAADIGIAMGVQGTDVAKEAADVILADDDFGTIVEAISEGKGIFFNIRNFLSFQLATSFAAVTIQTLAVAFRLPSPLNAMQILWINIIMDGPPAQSLGVEPCDDHILQAKPRKPQDAILTRALLMRAITSASLMVLLTLVVFVNELDVGQVTRRGTTMTFLMFVNCTLFNAYACRSVEKFFYEIHPFGNPTFLWAIGVSVLGQLGVIYFPPLQEVFQTEAVSVLDWMNTVVLSSSVLILDALRKKFFRGDFDCLKPKHRKRKEEICMERGEQ